MARSKRAAPYGNRILDTAMVPAGQLLANAANPYLHTHEQETVLDAMLKEIGFIAHVVVNRRTDTSWGKDRKVETIVDGHLRVQAAISHGGEEQDVPVAYIDVTRDEENALLASINPLAMMAATDWEKMDALVAELPDDLRELTAILRAEHEAILGLISQVTPGLTDPDDVPEERATDIKAGDLFKLGQHRLLCGDSTKHEDVARLMGNEKATLVFTDPPYGVAYKGGRNPISNTPRRKLIGDDSADLYLSALLVTRDFCANNMAMYLWFSGTHGAEVYSAVIATGYTVRALLIWNKIEAHYGNFMAQYMNKHEPFLYCVRGKPQWFGPTNEVTVWDVKQPSRNEFHSTQKPVELATRAIRNSVNEGGVVADWFLGSGSTLIAAEQTKRRCFAIELVPSFCQVAIDRWEAFTEKKAVRR